MPRSKAARMIITVRSSNSYGTMFWTRTISSVMQPASPGHHSIRISLGSHWVDPCGFRRSTTDAIELSSSPTTKAQDNHHFLEELARRSVSLTCRLKRYATETSQVLGRRFTIPLPGAWDRTEP